MQKPWSNHPNVKKEAQELLKGEKQRKTPCDIMNEAMPKNEREREREQEALYNIVIKKK